MTIKWLFFNRSPFILRIGGWFHATTAVYEKETGFVLRCGVMVVVWSKTKGDLWLFGRQVIQRREIRNLR